jgi:hypothetical protein
MGLQVVRTAVEAVAQVIIAAAVHTQVHKGAVQVVLFVLCGPATYVYSHQLV